jgi:hypothetical protein
MKFFKMGGISLQYNHKEKNESYAEVKLFLDSMQSRGAKLFLDDRKVSSAEAAGKLVREEHKYMADYVLGENGSVEQIRFDKVIVW